MNKPAFIVWLLLITGIIYSSFAHEMNTGTFSAQLMMKAGAPMTIGIVFIFNIETGPPPSTEKYWRVPDYFAPIDNNGRFSIRLKPGNYYMGAIQRKSGKNSGGPPQEGDYMFKSRHENGAQKIYTVKS